jgi:hypothetical protein
MDIPAWTRELDTLWQAVKALSRQARAAAGGQDTLLLNALDQLATALRTTQDARQRAHEAAETQGAAQRRDLLIRSEKFKVSLLERSS